MRIPWRPLPLPLPRPWRQHGRTDDDQRVMARALAVFSGVGATLILVALQLPGSHAPRAAAVIPLVAYAFTAALVIRGGRAPSWTIDAVVLVGVALVTAAVRYGGAMAGPLAMFYVWLALYAFCFFSPLRALVPMIAVAVCCALVSPTHARAAYWLLTVGTSVVAGLWVERLVHRAREVSHTDDLTGLPNRRWWNEEFARVLAQARRHDHPLSVVILDIDHFKLYNDEHGHQAGDRFLAETSAAWLSAVREGDALVRQGGEEFAALLPHCALDEAMTLADRLRGVMPSERTCSAGVAEWDGTESGEALIARADAALYEAKRAGRNRAVAAPPPSPGRTPGLDPERARWRDTVLAMLERHAVDVVYQPILDLTSHRVLGYEALARPPGAADDVSVGALFDAAERLGRSRDLDWLCRRAAVDHARELPEGLPLFINVSGTALLDPLHDVDQTLLLLRWGGRSPASVVLEITEREAITDMARLREVVAAHRRQGVRFAVDDLGSGHSTFELLAAVLPEFIKLGGPLVRWSDRPGERAAIAAAAAFAREVGARLIAEDVEDAAAARRMMRLGVEMGQGFWLGHPGRLPAEARVS